MASIWLDEEDDQGKRTSGGTGPLGAARNSVWLQQPKQPAWQTGGQPGSTRNAFDNEFNQKFFSLVDKYANEGRALDLYTDKSFTGVVTRDDPKSGKKFGEVWQDGALQYNVFDTKRSGLSEDQAYQLMAQYTLDGETQKRAYERGTLRQEVEGQRTEAEKDARAGISRQGFDRQVDRRQEELFDNEFFQGDAWGDEALVAGGAAGGLLAGAGVAAATGVGIPVAIGLGAAGLVLGAVGAWMNRDQLTEQVARATLMTEMANARRPGAGIAVAAEQAGQLGMQALLPVQNVVQGVYDSIHGEIGDNESAWYALDPTTGQSTREAWWDIANFAGGVAGGVGMGAGLGRAAYSATLIPMIGGGGAKLLYQGEIFNERTGEFQSIYTNEEGDFAPDRATAAWAAFGIDAVQSVGLFALGGAAANRGAQVARAEGQTTGRVSGFINRLGMGRRSDTRDVAGGFRFEIDPKTGRAVGDFGGFKNLHYTFAAPSEALRGITASALIRLKNRSVVSADDVYQYIKRIENRAGAGWGTVLVTSYAEGVEEATQTVLEQIATGSEFDLDAVIASAVQGAAIGAGFGISAARTYTTSDRRMFLNAKIKREAQAFDIDGNRIPSALPVLTRKEWEGMTDTEKRLASHLNSFEKLAMDEAVNSMRVKHATSLVTDDPTIVEKYKFAKEAIVQRIHERGTAQQTTNRLVIQAQVDPRISASRAELSLMRTEILLNNQREALQTLSEGGAADQDFSEETVALAGEARAELDVLLSWLAVKSEEYRLATSSTDHNRIINDINNVLSHWAEGTDLDTSMDVFQAAQTVSERQALARAYAVSLNFARDPMDQAGSVPLLAPYVSQLFTRWNSSTMSVPLEYLKAIGGDFDGDTMRSVLRLSRDEQSFRLARAGANLTALKKDETDESGQPILGTGGVVSGISTTTFEVGWIQKYREVSSLPQYDRVTGLVFIEIAGQVLRMAPNPEVRRELAKHLNYLFTALEAGDEDAITDFVSAVVGDLKVYPQLLEAGLQSLRPVVAELHRAVSQALERMSSRLARMDVPPRITTTPDEPAVMQEAGRAIQRPVAVSEGRELFMAGDATELFRLFQQVRFTPLRSPLDINQIGDTDKQTLMDIARTLRAMSEGQALARVEELEARSEAEMVSDWLQAMSDRSAQEGERIPPAILANMQVYDFNDDGPLNTYISLGQLLLRKAIQITRARYGDVIQNDPTMNAKYDRLESMTRAPHNRGKFSQKRAGAAFVYIFGHKSMGEIAGQDVSIVDASTTINTLYRDYRNMDRRSRQDWMKTARMEGWSKDLPERDLPYSAEAALEAGLTPYRAVIESIEEAANFDISMDAHYNPTGKWQDLSKKTSKQVEQIVTEIQQGIRAGALKESTTLTPESVRLYLEQNPMVHDKLLDFVATDPTAKVTMIAPVEVDGAVKLQIQPWVYEALAKDPKTAELELLMQSAILSWRALSVTFERETVDTKDSNDKRTRHERDYHRLGDRLHQLFFKLSYGEGSELRWATFFQRYEEILANGGGVDEFVRLINKYYKGNQAPFTAWFRDVANQDSDAILEFSPTMAGAAQREALNELSSAVKVTSRQIVEERAMARADDTFIATARTQYLNKDDSGPELLKLRQLIEFNIDYSPSAGISEVISQLMASARGLYANNADKAKSPEEFAGLDGQLVMYGDFAPNYNIVNTSTGAVDLNTVLSNPRILLEGPLEITHPDGRKIQWLTDDIKEFDPSDPVKFKESLTNKVLEALFDNWSGATRGENNLRLSKGVAQSLFQKLLIPSVMQMNPDGSGFTQRLLFQPSISEVASGKLYSNLFGDPKHSYSQRNKQDLGYYLSLVDGLTTKLGGNHDAIQFLNQYLQHRVAGLTHMDVATAHREAVRITTETAFVLQKIGDHISQRLLPDGTLASTEVDEKTGETRPTLDIIRDRVREARLDTWLSKKFSGGLLENVSREEIETWLDLELKQLMPDIPQTLADALVKARKDRDDDAMQKAWDDILAANAASPVFEKYHRIKFLSDVMLSREPVKALIGMYRYPADGPAVNNESRRALITNMLKALGTSLSTRAPWAEESIRRILKAAERANGTPGTSDAADVDFKVASRAIIAAEILRLERHQGSDEISIPEFPDIKGSLDDELSPSLKMWDPSQQYLLDDLLTLNPLTRAAAAISTNARRAHNPARLDLINTLNSTLGQVDRVAHWTVPTTAMIEEAGVRINSAPAPFVIEMNGQPEDSVTFAAATLPEHDVNAVLKYGDMDSFAKQVGVRHKNGSIIPLTLRTLISGDPLMTRLAISDDAGVITEMPIANLHGRVITSFKMNGQDVDMTGFSVETPAGRVLDLNALFRTYRHTRISLDSVIELHVVPQHSKIVEQGGAATGLANHSVFDGVIDVTQDFARRTSLIGRRSTINEGSNRRGQHAALKAARDGLRALVRATKFSYFRRIQQETDWQTNLAQVLHRKATDVSLHGVNVEPNPWQNYNADYKFQEIRHFVKGDDGQLWGAARVIQWQQANPGKSITEALGDGAMLYVPGDGKLRAMYGDRGKKAVNVPSLETWVGDASLISVFDGVATEDMKREIPGLFSDRPVVDAMSTELALRRPPLRYYSSLILDNDTILDMSRRMAAREERRNKIAVDRINDHGFDAASLSNMAVDILQQKIAEFTKVDWRAHGLPFEPTNELVQQGLNQRAHAELIESIRRESDKAVFLYENVPTNPNLTVRNGLLTPLTWDSVPGYQPGPGDIVVFNLDAYADDTSFGIEFFQDYEKLRRSGATISLIASSHQGRLGVAQAQFEQSSEYVQVVGSMIWRPREANEGKPKDTIALDGSLTALEWVTRENKEILLLSPDIALTEGIAVPKNAEQYESKVLGIVSNVIPTNPIPGFSTPADANALGAVQAKVKELLADPDRKLSDWQREGLERLDQKYTDAQQDAAVPLGELKQGDLIPVVRRKGTRYEIIFLRYGHTWERNPIEISEGLSEGDGVFFSKQPIDSNFTSFEGEVVFAKGHDRWGTEVVIRVPLGLLAEKLQLTFQGLKIIVGGTTQDRLRMPSTPLTPVMDAAFIIDKASVDAKQAYGGRVNNHRSAAMAFGWNVQDRMLEGYRAMVEKPHASFDDMMEFFSIISTSLPRIDPDDIFNSYKDLAELRTRFQIQGFENFDPTDENQAFLEAALFYLMTAERQTADDNPVRHIMGPYQGLITSIPQANSGAPLLPSVYMSYFDHLPMDHPARQGLIREWERNLGSDANGYYILSNDFRVTAVKINEDGSETTHKDLVIQIGELLHEGHSPEFMRMSEQRQKDKERWSSHMASLAMLTDGAGVSRSVDLTQAAYDAIVRDHIPNPSMPKADFMVDLQDVGSAVPDYKMRWAVHNPAQEIYVEAAHDMRRAYQVEIDESFWEKPDDRPGAQESRQNRVNEIKKRIAAKINLPRSMEYVIDHWIRMTDGSFADRDPNSTDGKMTWDAVMRALGAIEANVEEGLLPTVDGVVPGFDISWLQALFRANYNAPEGKRWLLRARVDDNRPLTADNTVAFDDWDGWVAVALGSMQTGQTEFYPVNLTALDGFYHTFTVQEDSLTGLGVSVDALREAELWDPELNRMVISIDPRLNEMAKSPEIYDAEHTRLTNLFGAQRHQDGRWQGRRNLPPDRQRRNAYMKKWMRKEGVQATKPTSVRQLRRAGFEAATERSARNSVVQTVLDLRHFTTLANPILYGGAAVETAMRGLQDNIVGLLMGTGTGAISGRIGNRAEQYQRTIQALSSNPTIIGKILEGLDFEDEVKRRNPVTRFTGKLAHIGNWFQDPTRFQSQHSMMRRYVEAVVDYINTDPGIDFSVEEVLYKLEHDPMWVSNNIHRAHLVAVARIAQMRSIKRSALGMAISSIYETLGDSSNGAVRNVSDIFLRVPLMYSTYMANVTTNMLGLQLVNDLLLMFLNGRKKGLLGGVASKIKGEGWAGAEETFDFTDSMDTIDLTRSAVSSGVSLSALAFGASAIGGLLGGEDDEEKRRRLALKYQTGSVIYDPRSLVNDWRNSEAIYLDAFPPLAALFGKTEGGQTPVMPHWIIKQFVSPLIGIQKAMDTGDFRQIAWGFQEAIGSMPIWNETFAIEAHQTFEMLLAQAQDVAADEPDSDVAQMAAMSLLTKAIMAYESMILESSFANLIYQNMDKYDRDPFKIPDLLVNGEPVRTRADVPAPTTMLNEFMTPEGEIRQAYATRDYFQGTLYGYSENRTTLAFLLSLGTGFQDRSMWRQNMVPKTRTIQKEEMTLENAESLVMAAFNQTGYADDLTAVPTPTTDDASWVLSEYVDGHERLTDEGAEAVIKGLWMGTVRIGDPALAGLYIPPEMRERLQDVLLDKFMQEGIDLGLSRKDAERRTKLIWYGPYDDSTVPGLADIVWDTRIPYARDIQYRQLNTTYITGPDGRPWATGLARNNFLAAFGFPVQPFYTDALSPGLPTDERLNAFDAGANVNTGLRALEKVDQSEHIPTPEEIGESIEKAINKLADKNYTPAPRYSNYVGGGYRGRGGYGGGGGARNPFMPFLNEMRSPFSDAIRDMYIQSVSVRRADVRRERFSSDRGRLKQWQ